VKDYIELTDSDFEDIFHCNFMEFITCSVNN